MAEYDKRIPEKLQLLRIGLGGKDDLGVFAYYPSTQQTNFAVPCFCLAPADDEPDMMDVHGAIEQTMHDLIDCGATAEDLWQIMGLLQEYDIDPDYRDTGEYVSVDLGYCIEGDLLGFEKVDPEASDVRSVFTDGQIAAIEGAFDVLPASYAMTAAQLLARHDLDRWHAFEVCEAVSASIPMDLAADIANPELSFKQARGLRYLAQTICDSHMQSDERVCDLFHRVAAHTDFSEDKIHAIRSVLRATPRLEFEDGWLGLSTDQLRAVRLALREDVPPSILHRYSSGEYPAANMDILTLAARDDEIKGPQLDKLLNPDLSLTQLVVAWTAAIDCGRGKLTAPEFDLICNPQLPTPVMSALRIGLTYHEMPYSVAVTVTPTTTPEQVWDLIYQGEMPEHGEVVQERHEPADIAIDRSDSGSLRDEAKATREASSQLSQEEATEQAPQREEIE